MPSPEFARVEFARVEFARVRAADADVECVAVFVLKSEGPEETRPRAVVGADGLAVQDALGIDLAEELAAVRFEGDLGAVARVPTRGRTPASLLLVVGAGPAAKLTPETLRRAAGAAARQAPRGASLALVVPGDLLGGVDGATLGQAVAEGAALGAYAYTEYRAKSHDKPSLERLVVLPGVEGNADDVERGVRAGAVVARATSLARDLVNTPPAAKRPPLLAERVRAFAEAAGLTVRIFDEEALREGGFGGILGVGQGSSEPPRLVELVHEPADSTGHVVLVGKGITFDSGGLSLKPTQSMSTMKSDMSGAAAVAAAMTALADLGVRTKVTGLLALAENMPSGDAIRVSDVLVHRGGKTVEVMNTDAEGRLVLADALAYASESEPDVMIDLATLTGAQIVSLGTQIAGLMGTDDGVLADLERAAGEAGERVWRLPLPEDYAEHLKSSVADLKNIGRPMQAGTLIAGLYLKEFTNGRPWAHLDIAGPAFTEDGDGFYTHKGGTGFGVRTLLRYLQTRG